MVGRFDKEPAQAPNTVALKCVKLAKSAEKGQFLFKRSSDQNAPVDQPNITFTDLGENRFRDVYGDRSGIISWGFHDPLKMWIVRRKSGNTELYKDAHDFHSWTKVDLTELSKAPFSNPTNEPKATQFRLFLEGQVAKGFPSMKTAESIIKVYLSVIDPKTNQPLPSVIWRVTNIGN